METLEIAPEIILSPYEIDRGKPMPNLTHGAIQANVIFELKLSYGATYRVASEVSLATAPDGSTPDLVLYPKRDLNFVNELARQTEAPLLTVEIQSPSQTTDEMIDKAARYFAFGVRSAWVVFPALKGVAVYSDVDTYQFFHHHDTLRDSVLNIELDLVKVFE